MTALSPTQTEQAAAICAQMLETIARIKADIDEMKAAAAEFRTACPAPAPEADHV